LVWDDYFTKRSHPIRGGNVASKLGGRRSVRETKEGGATHLQRKGTNGGERNNKNLRKIRGST